jgi:hypothetical protein
MLVQNTLIDRSKLSIGDGVIVTGVPGRIDFHCMLQLSKMQKCTISDSDYDNDFNYTLIDLTYDYAKRKYDVSEIYKPITITARYSFEVNNVLALVADYTLAQGTSFSSNELDIDFENYTDLNGLQHPIIIYDDNHLEITGLFVHFDEFGLIATYVTGSSISLSNAVKVNNFVGEFKHVFLAPGSSYDLTSNINCGYDGLISPIYSYDLSGNLGDKMPTINGNTILIPSDIDLDSYDSNPYIGVTAVTKNTYPLCSIYYDIIIAEEM